jgi:D-alanyl-D-alanine carboxypeptidase/D-alanyl-D-alanine-endopeptidase (penicillin-binding protein 4)
MSRASVPRFILAVAIASATLGVDRAQAQSGTSPVLATATDGAASAAGAATPTGHTRHHRARGSRTAALHYATPVGTPALGSDLGAMLNARVRSGQWGALVMSLTRGDTVFSYQPDAELQPASNLKLFTTALALQEYGADHEFSTDVLRAGTITPGGTLQGDLVLRGDGDPGISKRYIQGGAAAAMDDLAKAVVAAGIKRVSGNLIADASAFDPQRIPEGWKTRYLQSGYAARVSALSCNENLATVIVAPGSGKQPARVTIDPANDLPLSVQVRTVAGRNARIMARSLPDGGMEVRGTIGARAGVRTYQVVVEDPTAFTASAFRHALELRGVSVTGATKFATTPNDAIKVGGIASPPLSHLISAMNRESINHFAELLFRDAGRKAASDGVGSVETANALLQSFLTIKAGVAPGAVTVADGSGLSVLDRVTPRALVNLLAFANTAPWSDAFHASLPVAGESELLKRRMRATPAQGNLHAKTGTTNNVISLGGYVTARDGELLAFAFIYNGTDRWNAKSTIDAMGGTLAAFSR